MSQISVSHKQSVTASLGRISCGKAICTKPLARQRVQQCSFTRNGSSMPSRPSAVPRMCSSISPVTPTASRSPTVDSSVSPMARYAFVGATPNITTAARSCNWRRGSSSVVSYSTCYPPASSRSVTSACWRIVTVGSPSFAVANFSPFRSTNQLPSSPPQQHSALNRRCPLCHDGTLHIRARLSASALATCLAALRPINSS